MTPIILFILLILIVAFLLGPRLRLDAAPIESRVPSFCNEEDSNELDQNSLIELSNWVDEYETQFKGMIPGTAAHIQWANTDQPKKTRLVFLYVHGFSATWKETHPVTLQLAQKYDANVFQARITGHGMDTHAMKSTAREWLQSIRDCWDICQRIGDRVVVVATSTGAPLSVWLTELPEAQEKLHAFLFMSPNFKTRSKLSFLLTMPWAKHWIRFLIGKTRKWEPENEEVEKYWTYEYSTDALMEMQSVVDWFGHQDLALQQIPLAIMYMKNDPTISPVAAVAGYDAWGSEQKVLLPVEVDGDAPQHVFAGDITAPHRTDWVVDRFDEFLKHLEESDPV